jgi:hypothetical protein
MMPFNIKNEENDVETAEVKFPKKGNQRDLMISDRSKLKSLMIQQGY